MSFLQTLKNCLFGNAAPEKQHKPEQVNPVALPEVASKKIESEYLEVFPIAIQKTLDLTSGIPKDVKKTIYEKIFSDYSLFSRSENERMADVLFPLLENLDWHWIEWDYWKPICVKKRLFTNGMRCWCFPWPEELNIEKERAKYDPAKVFNVMTLKTAKERLTSFPEASSMKKVEIINFLASNKNAWELVIDPHIRSKWDRQKHYSGPMPKMVLSLMLKTIEDRTDYLRRMNQIKSLGGTHKEVFSFDYDEKIATYAKRLKNNPWKEEFGPNIPGLSLFIGSNFPKSRYG